MSLDPRRFVEVLQLAARQAGAVARHLQSQVKLERKGATGSPEAQALTAVDLATQEVILQLLLHELPDVALDAEEDTRSVARFPPPAPGRDLVVLDPIDGTLNYAMGSNDYAVMGALIRDGRFEASVLFFPAHDLMTWAIRGEGCFTPEGRVRVRPDALPDDVLISPRKEQAWRSGLTQAGFSPIPSRCSAVDATAPAIGRAIGSASRGKADRRRALGFLLTTEAGGAVRHGTSRWSGEDPDTLPDAGPWVAGATDAVADRIVQAIRA